MAYIKLIGKRDVDVAEDTNEKLLSDADYDRVATWAAVKYLPNGVSNGDGTFRQPNGDEIFHALTEAVYLGIKNEVDAWYFAQIKAAKEAEALQQFTPIALTPV